MASMPLTSNAAQQQAATRDAAETKQRSLPVFDWTIARIMAVLATIMLPTGLVLIVLGWWGAAHTPFVFEQIPYLISGGLLGIGLMAAGGLLYMGSWLGRLAEQQRDEGEKVREALKAIRQELEYLPGLVGGGEARTPERTFVATKTGTMFHLADCSVVKDRQDLRDVSATDGLDPCKLCHPTAAEQ